MSDAETPDTPPEPPEKSAADAATERAQRREQAACDSLRTLIRDHFMAHFGGQPAGSGPMALTLSMEVNPSETWALQFDPPLSDQVHAQFEDTEAGRDVYRGGRTFCYRCRSSECEHSVPPEPSFVFKEYTPNGMPQWCEFAQALLDAGDERAARLYDDRPAVLTRVQYGSELKSRQLSSYGKASKTYTILGQVIAGHFKLPSASRKMDAQSRAAVTFQVVETRNAKGHFELKLNAICGGLDEGAWNEAAATTWKNALGEAFERAKRAVGDVERRTLLARQEGDPGEIRKQLKEVPHLLRELAQTLERGERRERRRTIHAKQRHREPERPVDKAIEDAHTADAESLFFDERKDTWIACGKKGRAHVFSREGLHVTSFVLPPGGADARVKKNRWRTLSTEEIAQFKTSLNGDH